MTVSQLDGDGQSSSLAPLIWLMMTIMVMVTVMTTTTKMMQGAAPASSPLPPLDGNAEMERCARKESAEGGRGSDVRPQRARTRQEVAGKGGQGMAWGRGGAPSTAERLKRLQENKP